MSLKAKIEAVLFLTAKPIKAQAMARIVNADVQAVRQALLELVHDYEERQGGLEIADEDGYSFQVKDAYANLMDEFLPVEMTAALIRTLSAIAIKQPITQSEIIRVRGAGAYEHIKELVNRELVAKRDEQGGGRSPILSTTKKFQEYFRLTKDGKDLRNYLKGQVRKAAAAADAAAGQLAIPDMVNAPETDEQLNQRIFLETASMADGDLGDVAAEAISEFAPEVKELGDVDSAMAAELGGDDTNSMAAEVSAALVGEAIEPAAEAIEPAAEAIESAAEAIESAPFRKGGREPAEVEALDFSATDASSDNVASSDTVASSGTGEQEPADLEIVAVTETDKPAAKTLSKLAAASEAQEPQPLPIDESAPAELPLVAETEEPATPPATAGKSSVQAHSKKLPATGKSKNDGAKPSPNFADLLKKQRNLEHALKTVRDSEEAEQTPIEFPTLESTSPADKNLPS